MTLSSGHLYPLRIKTTPCHQRSGELANAVRRLRWSKHKIIHPFPLPPLLLLLHPLLPGALVAVEVEAGDEVLRAVARALTAAAPPGALVARLGGEEFAVLGDAGTSIAPATLLTDLRRARMPFDIPVTTSIGTCTGPLLGEADWKALYRQADRALYAAKAAGRDRACDAASLGLAV